MPEIRDATWGDFDAIVDLLDHRSRAVFGVSEVQVAHVRQRWELPGAHPGWVAVDDGAISGYATLDAAQEATVASFEAGTADALFAQVQADARRRGFVHLTLTVVEADTPIHELVQRNELTLDREILRMWRGLDTDVPPPNWPEDAVVRSYRDADGERVHALLDEAYAGWDTDYVARAHDDWLAFMTGHDEFDPALWFLVERDGELVACALHWREHRGRGWVKDIVVRTSERGCGIGKSLLLHALRVYCDRGATRVGLKVDSTNPTGAPELYARVGFEIDQRYGIWMKRL